jgi:uncharacterized membrane protein
MPESPGRHGHRGVTVYALVIAVIVLNVTGNLLFRIGMKAVGEIVSVSPAAYLKAFTNFWIIAGIIVQIGWLLSQLSLLSWADLSYVLPVTSPSYVLISIVGAFVLGERVSPAHWLGVVLILFGVVIVGRTRPRTNGSSPGETR